HVPVPGSGALRRAIDAAYRRHAPPLVAEPGRVHWYEDEQQRVAEFAASHLFGSVTTRRYPWSQVYNAADYVALVQTYSEHRLLPPAQLAALTTAIHDAIVEHGGICEVSYTTHLYSARRAA